MMRLGIYGGERNLSELAGRLYRISGKGAGEVARKAEAALLDANPQLRTLGRLPEGTVLVVPEVKDAAPSDDVTSVAGAAVALVEGIRRDLTAFRNAVEDSARTEADALRNTIRIAKSSHVRGAARTVEPLKTRLPQVIDTAGARLKKVEALRGGKDNPLDQLEQDLARLLQRLV
jgi:seryl-tRNA(Sec) selenium transferase